MISHIYIPLKEADDLFQHLRRLQRGELPQYGHENKERKYTKATSRNSCYDRLIFRGQEADWKLENTLERACKKAGTEKSDGCDIYDIENEMVREFRRLYSGNDRDLVCKDTLYCLSLMRHFGAPTRLIDFDYSVYIAAYFALEEAHNMTCNDEVRSFAIWCIDTNLLKWLVNKKLKPYGLQLIKEMRDKNDDRDESSFRKIYIDNGKPFIGRENPIKIHDRLHLQHGLFLCPNNGIQSFHDNILAFNTESELNAIYKIEFTMEFNVVRNVLEEFRRMNISRESLFPGLDGFAQSMKYHLLHYRNQCLLRKGVVG